ncbi:AsnC family transcriptional regulator [Pokkaliibacter sp. MBI-7]|uniref:Lrp/AsnC family transcriptional regulator n=1 Tax=Pokkaliibacter sp. MBI-7 TaxID=3040600 RepID=UPI002447162F|nr:AsnC family transcriptional regulator [Pokkaliibacter sp. MBI-7]MDH2432619.1 AsnC family transcriptional regulator [Pokkaliibacter sp. MBI-7]
MSEVNCTRGNRYIRPVFAFCPTASVEIFHGRSSLDDQIGQADDIDRQILRVLASDGRVNNQQLAEQVNLSATPCWNRVTALEEAAVISG